MPGEGLFRCCHSQVVLATGHSSQPPPSTDTCRDWTTKASDKFGMVAAVSDGLVAANQRDKVACGTTLRVLCMSRAPRQHNTCRYLFVSSLPVPGGGSFTAAAADRHCVRRARDADSTADVQTLAAFGATFRALLSRDGTLPSNRAQLYQLTHNDCIRSTNTNVSARALQMIVVFVFFRLKPLCANAELRSHSVVRQRRRLSRQSGG
jgi:hypothetical protein